jgi:tRNA pseudouridine55 synthase
LSSVTTTRLEIVSIEADTVTLRVDCSAGFYVRSLAHDLGERLGVGGHLAALRRTRTGDFGLDRAMTLDAAECNPEQAVAALVPLADMLPALPAVTLSADGVSRVGHGQEVRPGDVTAPFATLDAQPSALAPRTFIRLLDERGQLVAVAQPTATGALHPSVVLV